MNHTANSPNFFEFCSQLDGFIQKTTELPSNIHYPILLFAIWHALRQHGRLKAKDFMRIDPKIEEWRCLVSHRINLSKSRLTQSKSKKINILYNQLDKSFQQIDLLSQQIEQEFIIHSFAFTNTLNRTQSQILTDACANIARYVKLKKAYLNQQNFQLIKNILQHVFCEQHPVTINDKLKKTLNQAKIADFDSLQLTFDDL